MRSLRPHRERDVDPLDRSQLGLVDQVLDGSHAAAEIGGDRRIALLGPIVEEARQRQPHLRQCLDVPRQLKTKLVDSDDGELPSLVAQKTASLLNPAGDDSSGGDQHGGDDQPQKRRATRKLAEVRGHKRQQQQRHPGAAPADQRADDLPVLGHAVPVAVHVADFGQQTEDDDRRGAGDDVVIDRGREPALHRDGKPHCNATGIGKAIPCPPSGPFLVDVLAILHYRFRLNLFKYSSSQRNRNILSYSDYQE